MSSDTKKLVSEYQRIQSSFKDTEEKRKKINEEIDKLKVQEGNLRVKYEFLLSEKRKYVSPLKTKFLSECKNSERGLEAPDGKILQLKFVLRKKYGYNEFEEIEFSHPITKFEDGKLHVDFDAEIGKKYFRESYEENKHWEIGKDNYESRERFSLTILNLFEFILEWNSS